MLLLRLTRLGVPFLILSPYTSQQKLSDSSPFTIAAATSVSVSYTHLTLPTTPYV